MQESTCPKHGKNNELICINCRHRICHNCALFGEHKGHDIREQDEAMKEVVVRTEVLMEMFEQLDQECAKLLADQSYQDLLRIFNGTKDNLKGQVSKKFKEWHDILNRMEQNVHETIDERFRNVERAFDEEKLVLERLEEDNRVIQFKVGDMLNNYMTQIEANPEYIAYDILDANPDNLTSDTVETLYQQIEEWMEESKVTLQYEKLKELEWDYD